MTAMSSQLTPHILLIILMVLSVNGLYLPLLPPTNFCKELISNRSTTSPCHSEVLLYVNKLDSTKVLIPYEYSSFNFCPPGNKSKNQVPVENLGQVVFGDRLRISPFKISFGRNDSTKKLCEMSYDAKELEFLRDRIHENYMQQWVIDNMPVTWCYAIVESDQPFCTTRFPVGCFVNADGVKNDACYLSSKLSEPGATYLFNHHKLVISYHNGTESSKHTDGRIVRAQIELKSCASIPCTKPMKLPEKIDKEFKITYSYSIEFENTPDIRWASRWDYILNSYTNNNVEWFSVGSNIFIIFLLTSFTTPCLIIYCYRTAKDNYEVTRRDVFRPPTALMLLSVFVGNGAQIICTTMVVLVFACLGLLSPPNRGALMTAVLVVYPIQGFVAGFVSAAVYKLMGGLRWKSNVLMTSFFVPGIIFVVFFTLNLFLWYAGSSAAIPFTTLLALLCLWFGISVPLTFFGAFLSPTFRPPVSTSSTDEEISTTTRWCFSCKSLCSSITGGIFPFACVFIQQFYLLNSIWSGSVYYKPGFFMLAFLFVFVVCAEISIIYLFCSLRSMDYRWWWSSFFCTATSAIYAFPFCVHYFCLRTTITGLLSSMLFFGYTFIMMFMFFLMTGSIGFLTSLIFVWKIYSSANNAADSEYDKAVPALDNVGKLANPSKETRSEKHVLSTESQIYPWGESLQVLEDTSTL